MRLLKSLSLALTLGFQLTVSAATPPEYESLKADTEKLYADGSFAKAHEFYAGVNLTNLPPAETRWVINRSSSTYSVPIFPLVLGEDKEELDFQDNQLPISIGDQVQGSMDVH